MFYQLTRSSAQDTLTTILTRAVGQGWRVMIRSPDRARLERLDAALWLGPEDGFLPHGLQGGAQDADQPVLLGQGAASNGARGVMLLDGAETDLAEAQAMDRVWVIFDGADGAQLTQARAQWKRLTEAGLAAQYWSEDSGRWEKKAEKPHPETP
ncbi:MAG: DNA polymerase III subunit chi [Pseudomonadota bacterium]